LINGQQQTVDEEMAFTIVKKTKKIGRKLSDLSNEKFTVAVMSDRLTQRR